MNFLEKKLIFGKFESFLKIRFSFAWLVFFWKNLNFEKWSNAERSRKFHKSILKRFPTLKSKKSPGGGEEENEVQLGLPCGRQKQIKCILRNWSIYDSVYNQQSIQSTIFHQTRIHF